MMALSYSHSAFRPRKVTTIKSKQLSKKRRSNVIVLFCKAERDRVQGLIRTLIWTNFKVYLKSDLKSIMLI